MATGPWIAGSITTFARRDAGQTVAFLDARAASCDRLQQEACDGPSYDALRSDQVQVADDLAADSRWPRWSPMALALGVRRSLSVPLFTSRTLGTINLYATRPGERDVTMVRDAEEIAAYASVLLASIMTEDDLRQAIPTRGLIGQAQGILMRKYGFDPEKSFEVLRRTSQRMNIKIIAIAEILVATGQFDGLSVGRVGAGKHLAAGPETVRVGA